MYYQKHLKLYVRIFTSTIFLVSCVTQIPENESQYPDIRPRKSSRIEALYNWISLKDTLKVFSTQFLDDSTFKFHGKKLDNLQLSWFPERFNFYFDEDQPIYACYKFKIDEFNTGLITRVYSEYVSSKIQLFIYYHPADSIYNYRDLAENFGDGGDVFLQTSWLYLNKNKSIGCFSEEINMHYHEVDNLNDTTVSRGVNYKYIQLLGEDTVRVMDEKLIRKFR